MAAFKLPYLTIKEDFRSRVECNGLRLRKTYYLAEPADKEIAITRLAHDCCPNTVVGIEDVKRSEGGQTQWECTYYRDSLESFLQRKKRLLPEEITAIVIDLVETILILHARQIAHRDLNISNIVMDYNTNHILLIDFEISSTPDFPNNGCISTIDYASPELLRDLDSGCIETSTDSYKNDQWALGKVVYDLVCGRRTQSMARLKNELIKQRIIAATGRCQELRQVLETCLEVDFRQRGLALREALATLQTKERRFPLKKPEKPLPESTVGRNSVKSGVCPNIMKGE